MKNLTERGLRRVAIEDDSASASDDVSLGNLSDEDLDDSEGESSIEDVQDQQSSGDGYDDDDDDESNIEHDLADIPFGTLVRAQSSIEPKGRNASSNEQLVRQDANEDAKDHKYSKTLKRKRENKHAPMEMSSKRPVGRSREAVEVVKVEKRDPRFDPDNSSRPSDSSRARKNYSFLEGYKQDEMRILKESIKKEKDLNAKAKLEKTLASMQSREQASKERERRARVLAEYKQKEKAAAKDGKIPYHLKEAEKNKLYLKDKFDSMKDSKGLDKFLEKKRKRRSQKDRKRALPT